MCIELQEMIRMKVPIQNRRPKMMMTTARSPIIAALRTTVAQARVAVVETEEPLAVDPQLRHREHPLPMAS